MGKLEKIRNQPSKPLDLPKSPAPVEQGMKDLDLLTRIREIFDSRYYRQAVMRTPEGDLPIVGVSCTPTEIIFHFEHEPEPEG